MSSATAWPATPATAMSRVNSDAASRSAWSASMCRSRCPWPGTASAAGSVRSSATCTPTAKKACASTRSRSRSCNAGPRALPRVPSSRCRRRSSKERHTMKIALDPYMHRHLPLVELPRLAAELGYRYIELSPRADFLDWWVHPRAYPERIREFKAALRDHGVKIASLLPMYRWASPNEDERQAAVRYWKAAIGIAQELEVDTMNSEFGR